MTHPYTLEELEGRCVKRMKTLSSEDVVRYLAERDSVRYLHWRWMSGEMSLEQYRQAADDITHYNHHQTKIRRSS